MQLVIGNKNYSSWSMRPWVLMRELGIPFDERMLRLDPNEGSAFKQAVAQISPAGLVPVLVDDEVANAADGGIKVWDTLAIAEYLHDRYPAHGVWPAALADRARARCLAAEMHAGFGALRNHCPMNIEAHLPEVGARVWAEQPEVRRQVARIEALWADALAHSGGPFLFGRFGAVDAMYAPVVLRLRTYALPVSEASRSYMDRVVAAPGVAAWVAEALAERDFLAFDEPYRADPRTDPRTTPRTTPRTDPRTHR